MSSKRILVVVCSLALALLVALSISLLRVDSNAPVQASIGAESAKQVDAPSSDLEAAHASARDARGVVRSDARTSAAAPRLPAFSDVSGLRLFVLERESRKALPGAEVHVWEKTSDELGITRDYTEWIGPDLEAFLCANGKASTADEDGAVDLPRSAAWRFAIARSGDQFAFVQLEPGVGGLAEILLYRQHTLTVHVRDERGRPRRGVHVGLGRCDDPSSFWEDVTDTRGECRIPNVDTLIEEYGVQSGTPFAVRVASPCRPRVEEWLYPDRLPDAPIDLVLPATGSLRVTVVDAARVRVPVSGEISVGTGDEPASGRPSFADMSGAGRYRLVDGAVIIEDVGLGLDFWLDADLPGTGDASVAVRGPLVAGEQVAVEIPLEEDHTLLVGRLVDESGKPLAHATFDWRRLLDDGANVQASGRNKLTTDAEGRFQWTLRRSTKVTGDSTHRTGYLCDLSHGVKRLQATIDFPLEIATAVTDLGDVVVALRGPLFSGKVVDEEERGVAGISIEPQIRSENGESNIETFDTQISAADGTFAIFGPCLALDFVLAVYGAGISPNQLVPVSCRGGTAEVTIHARTLGGLEGTALVDHDWSGEGLDVRFVHDGNAPDDYDSPDWTRAGDRVCFRYTGLRPGPGRVEFFSPEDAPIAAVVVANIEIVGAEIVRPKSLVDVDLRGKLPKAEASGPARASLELEVMDARGKSVPRGIAWAWPLEGDGTDERLWAGGRVRFVEPQTILQLEIWAPGSRARILTPPFKSGPIVLAPELEVELVFDLPKELRDERLTIVGSLSIIVDGEQGPTPNSLASMNGYRVDHNGKAAVRLPTAGKFGTQLTISRHGVPGFEDMDEYELNAAQATFDVHDTDGRQVAKFTFDPAIVKQCLVDLGLAKD